LEVVIFNSEKEYVSAVYSDVLGFFRQPAQGNLTFDTGNAAKVRKSFQLDTFVRVLAKTKQKLGLKKRLHILSGLRKWNQKQERWQPYSAALRGRMQQHFADDVALLGHLLGRDLGHWLKGK